MKGRVTFSHLLLVIWMLVIILALVLNLNFASKTLSPHYDQMIEASNITKDAMAAIKQYKVDNGIELSESDKLSTGMIGPKVSAIYTTEGNINAKRTSCDPNWAAVIIKYFVQANLVPGDHVGFVFSSSFPTLNIACLAAAQVYGLKTCVMASIGASCYGATDTNFTFYDMIKLLNERKIINIKIDYLSFGGAGDVGKNFHDEDEFLGGSDKLASEVMAEIYSRVDKENTTFIYEEVFAKNINLRIKYFKDRVPNIKFLINAGGSSVGIGVDSALFLQSGYVAPSVFKYKNDDSSFGHNEDWGLLQYFLSKNIPVASLLNIRGLAAEHGIKYDPDTLPEIGAGNMYFVQQYNLTVTIVALVVSVLIAIFYYFYKSRVGEEIKNERNYILH